MGVAAAVQSARAAEPSLSRAELVDLVEETSAVPARLVRAAVDYWTAFPDEIDGWLARSARESEEAEVRWRRARARLGR